MLNRSALILRPKQPYLDWAAALDDTGVVPDPRGEQTVYLVPQYGNDDEAHAFLQIVYSEIFERELAGWHTDESEWPANRDFGTFLAWFAVENHSVIEDLIDAELFDDAAEP